MKTTRTIRRLAAEMLDELESSFSEYVLIPAPDPRHSDHKIRTAQFGNPRWYSELCAEHVSIRGRGKKRMRRARTFIIRSEVLKSLKRIASGQASNGYIYDVRLSQLIKRKIAWDRRRKTVGNIYERDGMHDLPF